MKRFIVIIALTSFFTLLFSSNISSKFQCNNNQTEVTNNRTLDTELFILTVDSLETYFEELAEIKTEEGFVTEIITTTSTTDSCYGIRNWLKTEKQNNSSFQYLIIGGDENIIPTYPYDWNHGGNIETSSCDFYYSNVLSTWPDTICSFRDIDITSDIYVGRLPVRSQDEVERYIEKYDNYRKEMLQYTDNLKFISTNVMGNSTPISDIILSETIDHARNYVNCDSLYSSELVDTLNGAAAAVIDVFQDRDFSFLYMMCHGIDRFVINDSEFDDDDEWWIQGFGKHQQNITFIDQLIEEGQCLYSYQETGDHAGEYRYYYIRPETSFIDLESELPSTSGNTYIAWLGACMTTDMLYESNYSPCLRDSTGEIIKNRNYNGDIFEVYTDSIPTPIQDGQNCISKVYFNDIGGPVAVYAAAFLDYPLTTAIKVQEFFDLQFIDEYHNLGDLLNDCWDKPSFENVNPQMKEVYLGYTLFGDPSMDVWSAKAKQLVLSENITESLITTHPEFEVYDSQGEILEALVCVIDDNGEIQGRGLSPYIYNGTIDDDWIITANKANYIQDRREYSYLNSFSSSPYEIDFSDGFDKNWRAYPDTSCGRIEISEDNTPTGRDNVIKMDSSINGQYATNNVELHLNLTGKNRLMLDFLWKDISDESHNEDGVYISDDNGSSFEKIYSLTNGNGWEHVILNLDSLVTIENMNYNRNFIIKFQQKDNYGIPTDGIAINDVQVYSMYADIPYLTGFESGFDEYWEIGASYSHGRTIVTSNNGPYAGSYHITMDSDSLGCGVINNADLHLDLDELTSVSMAFRWKDFKDQYQANDGVYFSDDGGANFTKVYDLNGPLYPDNTWAKHTLNVSSLAASASLDLTSQFVIRFQHYGDGPISLGGFAFDEILIDGNSRESGDANKSPETIYNLKCYPNPFNPSTTICFSTAEASEQAELKIYNTKGQKLRTLLNGRLPAGDHQLEWNGKDDTGKRMASGVYFYRLTSGNQEFSGKMIMLK